MEKKEFINIIDELTKMNSDYRAEINKQLNRISGFVEQAYNQGAEDAWELARKVCVYKSEGGYTSGELMDIFETGSLVVIFDNFTAVEAMAKVKEYEERKKKEEKESQRFERGDAVEFNAVGGPFKAIFIEETNDYYTVLCDGDYYTSRLEKDLFQVRKTGKHIDLSLE